MTNLPTRLEAAAEGSRELSDLRQIAAKGPDESLGVYLSKRVPHLAKRGWLRVSGCSDGDYVDVTEAGWAILEKADG